MTAAAEAHRIYDDGLPVPRRYWSIAAMSLAVMMAVLDSTIANVALPSIGRDLGASPAASIWIVNAYQVAIVVSLLPLASLGEIVGFRRISQGGLLVFTLASLGCALAPDLTTLSLARVMQGFGAAGIMAVNGALVRFTYPHKLLGRAVGVTAMVTATSSAVGPTVASAILSVAHWRWLFAVNVPIGVITILIARWALPYNALDRRPLNWVGAALNAATFGLFITGAEAFSRSGAPALAALQMLGGVVFGALLLRRESRRRAPLVPVDLLRIPAFTLSVGTSICSFAAQMLALVSLPFHLQHRMGYSAVETGLLITPWPLAVTIAAPLAGRLSDRWPGAVLGGIGLALLSVGLVLLALLAPGTGPVPFVWRMALCGVGFGMFQTPNNRILLGSAPRARAGGAGGMLGTARLTGQSLGAVGVALCFRQFPQTATFWALGFGAAAAAVAAGVSLTRLSASAPQSRTAAQA